MRFQLTTLITMKTTSSLVAVVLAALAGCAPHSSNLKIGNDQSYVSLADQRDAIQKVIEYPSIPPGAKVLGEIDAGRCHRVAGTTEPSEAVVLIDLKITAYARGADGIADISFDKQSGLTSNCWSVITGRATIFSNAAQ
ncbi:hypothetical protein ACSUZJ_07435 [Telluria sp. B2]